MEGQIYSLVKRYTIIHVDEPERKKLSKGITTRYFHKTLKAVQRARTEKENVGGQIENETHNGADEMLEECRT